MDFVDTKTLSQVLKLSTRRIQQLVNEGLPREKDGKYPLFKAIHWYIDYLRNLANVNTPEGIDHKEKLLRVKAEKEEIELKQLRLELFEADPVKQSLMLILSTMKTGFLSLPGRMSNELRDLEPAEIKAKLEAEVRLILDSTGEKIKDVCRSGGSL
jgi:phage terminase Nu1 subunit (DNA packaging protein)